MKAIKSIIILLVAIPAMAVYALFEAINALAIETPSQTSPTSI